MPQRKLDYKIKGLDCAEEVAVLKKEFGGREGIIDLDFDVLNARMTVTFNPETISEQQIIESFGSTGMKAIPWQQRAYQKEESFWQSKSRLTMTCLSAGFLSADFIIHWYIHGSFLDVLLGGLGEEHVTPIVSIPLYVCAIIAGAWFVAPKALCR
jgi:Cd2+/Zn2+-exporting ATPase